MKILAVDDDPFILELVSMVAGRAGFKDVSTALSGEIALEMLRKGEATYDCLLFDISMPGMDGIELCALTRSVPGYSKTPIIMLTAMADKSFVDRAFSAGATDYANKPFDIVELSARLRMAEELGAARRSTDADLARTADAGAGSVNTNPFPLAHEVRIEGVGSLIEYAALRNYLSQLSLTGIACTQVLAFKIDQIVSIHARASAEEFTYVLTEVASAILEALRNDTPMMAYAGNGTFLVVSGKPTMEPSRELEAEIQFTLDERDVEFDNGDPLDIDVSASNPVRPSTSKLQRVRRTFDRAIARAENRALRKLGEVRAPSIRLIGK